MTRTQDLGIHSRYFCTKSECMIPSKKQSVWDQIAYPNVTYALEHPGTIVQSIVGILQIYLFDVHFFVIF